MMVLASLLQVSLSKYTKQFEASCFYKPWCSWKNFHAARIIKSKEQQVGWETKNL